MNLLMENEPAGFMAIPRSILEAIFVKKRTVKNDVRVMFYYLLYKALWADNENLGLRRGDLPFTVKGLAEDCCHSERYMKSFISKLEECGQITVCKKGRISVMHFEKYDELCMAGSGKKKSAKAKANSAVVFDDIANFETFWNYYHDILDSVGKEDKNLACVEWHNLDKENRIMAFNNVDRYVDSLRDVRFAKKAVNYLKGKSYVF